VVSHVFCSGCDSCLVVLCFASLSCSAVAAAAGWSEVGEFVASSVHDGNDVVDLIGDGGAFGAGDLAFVFIAR
jgi:hypothetical protein